MFPQPRTARGKGVLDAEVRHGPLQAQRFAPRAHLHALRERPQIALPRFAPEPFLNRDGPKDAPPTQGFFFRTAARGCAAANSRPVRASACAAHWCMAALPRRRTSSTSSASIASAVRNSPSSTSVSARMASNRSHKSGRLRSRSIISVSRCFGEGLPCMGFMGSIT